MKTLSIIVKLQLLVVFVLGAAVFNSFAQVSKQAPRYTSTKYSFTFLIPEGSVKQPESSEENVVYLADNARFERGSGINLAVVEEPNAALVSQSLTTEESAEPFVNGIVEGFQSEPGSKTTVTEKNLMKIAGLNSVRVAALASFGSNPEIKIRLVAFAVPVPAHKRMYVFTITGVDKDFDKWLPLAEASVNSFALIKARPVKP